MTDKKLNRRDFLRLGIGTGTGLVGGWLAARLPADEAGSDEYVWQIDPYKCTQCGRCETECVLMPTAVKCVHAYALCGYCDFCFAYLRPNAKPGTAAEVQLCPTDAIKRTFIEEPYYEYTIDEPRCIGCAKCVKGCTAFGNASLYLQVRHDRCINCNDCAIARVCPSDAFKRVPASEAYILKASKEKHDE
ncbi:ferredoxin [Planctomycetota bacterium]